MSKLDGKVAVVIGGSGGIGAASAQRLAAEGARVLVGYNRSQDRAEALVAQLAGQGHGVFQIAIEDSQSVLAAAAAVAAQTDKVDILVNSAGVTRPVPHADLEALDDALFDSILIGNVRGPFSVIRALRSLLEAAGSAVVVNISSISGFTGSGSNVAYCASKGALDTMALSLGRALGPAIRVVTVSPGAVATDFVAGRGRDALEKIAASTPLKTIVEPDDVAEAVYAATQLRATTGARIVVDGGRFLV